MSKGRTSRAALEMVNSEKFKRLVDTDDINVSDLTELLVDSRLPDSGKVAGYVIAWEDYVLVVDSEVAAPVSNPVAMMELLERRGPTERKEE